MTRAAGTSRHVRSASARWLFFFAFWVVLAGVKPADLAAGAIAATLAAWLSLRFLPSGYLRVRPLAFAAYGLRFTVESVKAGLDVAWRAFHPRLPLRPGFVVYSTRLPAGPQRDVFCAITSLMPGTLPCGPEGEDGIVIHCLDTAQPVAAQLAMEEALIVRALGGGRGDG